MARFNENFLELKESYLFSEVAKRVSTFKEKHPERSVIRLGIGDVTLPLGKAVVEAMHRAADEMGKAETFRGYGPEQGYDFLRKAIAGHYRSFGVELDIDEIFVSDGAKSDTGNITDLFGRDNTVLIPDPVYPVYVDTNTMNSRNIVYINGTAENDFLPMPDRSIHADIIYICSPNNPTGACYNRAQLREWVDYALENDAVILFDSAYESFVSDSSLPHSIYEIEGAESCAVEFCSLSKTAGFTGTRCGYTIVPKAITSVSADGREMSLNKMWNRRQCTKFNGVPYVIQRAAEAVFSEEGKEEAKAMTDAYMQNARIISDTMERLGIRYTGGINSPYIWFECPFGMNSWDFFDFLLEKAGVVGTPGAGFGSNGDNWFRLTAFNSKENTVEAMERFRSLLKKD
ncbi:LL-diaminopimelate aminotransferase [Ruminococcus flavefaciens]|uniref:LL-diaminopimelate aminotransferase n=1 Tax=Ruminococcus flavefaciens TaxID=1265 RepID=A0A315Y699_RUMFL|nr:LL-diaminopimelate aminotransferase [Ruminococcus flavefaciens]PWJ15508.1 LL-diaminopimelate aminotransferase [Ruminococcus flavefaciens]SSA40748.1 LL-diaminopimelate aminotransferase apoenzyme [Ruminococcus flavefaciens]